MRNQEWDIRPRDTECRQCQVSFTDQQAYVSRLIFSKDGYERSDYCKACWVQQMKIDKIVSVWNGIYKMPPPKPEEPLKKETVESLLRRLIECHDEVHRNVIFILIVMLERRRILVERDVQRSEDGNVVRVYEHRETGETFVITDPMLRMDQIESVQEEVMAMLSGRGPEETRNSERGTRKTKIRAWRTEDGGRKTEDGGRKTEDGRRMTDETLVP